MALEAPFKDIEFYTPEELEELLDWYDNFYRTAYKKLFDIFKLPADDSLWDKYEKFGTTGMPEQYLFDSASKELRKEWAKFYKPNRRLRRGKGKEKSDVQGSEGDIIAEPIQSE